jgi:hypothetical protein
MATLLPTGCGFEAIPGLIAVGGTAGAGTTGGAVTGGGVGGVIPATLP